MLFFVISTAFYSPPLPARSFLFCLNPIRLRGVDVAICDLKFVSLSAFYKLEVTNCDLKFLFSPV